MKTIKKLIITFGFLFLIIILSVPFHEGIHVALHDNISEIHIWDSKAFAIGAAGYIITNDTSDKLGLDAGTEEIFVSSLTMIICIIMITFIFIYPFIKSKKT